MTWHFVQNITLIAAAVFGLSKVADYILYRIGLRRAVLRRLFR